MRDVCPMQCRKPKICKPFCHAMRRDKACRYHPGSCSGCDWCEWTGKGFVPLQKKCPRWCHKYMFTGSSPEVNPGSTPGCYEMQVCQGCPQCNWQKVHGHALQAQKEPAIASDVLSEWTCPLWCTKTHKPKNLCKYPHCHGCPSCALRRLEEENSTVVETPY